MTNASKVPAEYRGLYDYLLGRYADRVVLSFLQIEDLTGATLPPPAYSESWWGDSGEGGTPSSQSRSWTEANRTANPNLRAGNVTFDRR